MSPNNTFYYGITYPAFNSNIAICKQCTASTIIYHFLHICRYLPLFFGMRTIYVQKLFNQMEDIFCILSSGIRWCSPNRNVSTHLRHIRAQRSRADISNEQTIRRILFALAAAKRARARGERTIYR